MKSNMKSNMKRLVKLFLLCGLLIFSMNTYANEGEMPNDTIFKYKDRIIKIETINDSTRISQLALTPENEALLEEDIQPSSSIVYDGASYNFAFSWKKRKKLSSHWSGFGMSFMNYDDSDIPNGELRLSTSHNFSFNIIEYYIPLGYNWLLVTGLGSEWSRYHFKGNAALTSENGITLFKPAPDGVTYRSSKLLAYYITIPLLLEYQIPVRKGSIHFSAGAVAFFKYYSKSQTKYFDNDGNKVVQNWGKDLNMRPIDIKLRGQIGFKDFALFGYYSPISMFKKDQGPDLQMYSLGAMLTF